MQHKIQNIQPLLQDDYGELNDCTLTSITTIIKYFCNDIPVERIYTVVEAVAQQHFYSGDKGTNPLLITNILNKVLDYFSIKKKSGGRYLRNVGYNLKFIQQQINLNQPVILNMHHSNNNYYQNHTVLIIGYVDNFLLIYDNWTTEMQLLDYYDISLISSINYLK